MARRAGREILVVGKNEENEKIIYIHSFTYSASQPFIQ